MVAGLDGLQVRDGQRVDTEHLAAAVTAGRLIFEDGATQTFDPDGATTYVDAGGTTRGEWYADGDGNFGSFWPPSYRATYDLTWIVEDGVITGLRFAAHGRGGTFAGRYENPA